MGTELRRADARLQGALAEVEAVAGAIREGDDKHILWLNEMENAIAKLRKDNRRLERSTQQAAMEESRLSDTIRDGPEQTQQVLANLMRECCRLEEENQR